MYIYIYIYIYVYTYMYIYIRTHTVARRVLRVYELQSSKHMEVSVPSAMEVSLVSQEQNLFILGMNNAYPTVQIMWYRLVRKCTTNGDCVSI